MAQRLAGITGRSPHVCKLWLRKFDNDIQRVIAHAAKAPTRSQVPITVADRTFPNHMAFAHYIQTNYGPTACAVKHWLSSWHLSPEQCLERARAYRKKHRKPVKREGEVVLFGWHFASPNALCTYYKISYPRFRAEWRARAPGTPAHAIPSCMLALAQLWELGRLDERNRHPPEVEARLPKSCLPTNPTINEKVLTTYERRHLDCLQPEGVMTERRHGLAWLDRMRHRVAS